jgi:hypothetical protein
VNKLDNLGITISSQDCVNEILRPLNMEWLPKVTAIKEAQDLTLELTILFGKLREDGQTLQRLNAQEENSKSKEKTKEKKGFALKVEEEEGDSTPIKIPPTTTSNGVICKRDIIAKFTFMMNYEMHVTKCMTKHQKLLRNSPSKIKLMRNLKEKFLNLIIIFRKYNQECF